MNIKAAAIFMGLLTLLLSCGKDLPRNREEAIQGDWKFHQQGDSLAFPTSIPSDIYWDLWKSHQISNPFWASNADSLSWIAQKSWVYECDFEVDETQWQYDHIDMIFKGLDTYAEIFINGEKTLESQNMFRQYTLSAKEFLHLGSNHLRILFHAPLLRGEQLWRKDSITYPADNDKTPHHVSVFSRKAAYQYGWDWGPKIISSGIWQGIDLHYWNHVKLGRCQVVQQYLSGDSAALILKWNVQSTTSKTLKFHLSESSWGDSLWDISFEKGENQVSIPLSILQPKLWWPRAWGQPHLYDFRLEILDGKNTLASTNQKVGLRTIVLVQDTDSQGQSFYFKVNGKPFYAKGANVVPLSSFPAKVGDSTYQAFFGDVVESNINMLRLWGGGYYEKDRFYELADSLGILLWQDFMFSCTLYPSDTAFLQEVQKEVSYQIQRLRNHPSLAFWCGNNEVEVGWKNWGWQQSYAWDSLLQEKLWRGYSKLFDSLIPRQLQKYDPSRSYIPSSPISNWGKLEDFKVGDNHYWGVWWGKQALERFNDFVPRFMSEYGFQGMPEMKTIAAFADSSQWDMESESMRFHQKSSIGNATIQSYLLRDFPPAQNFEEWVYLSQLLQARAYRMAIEAHRRHKPFNMGTLYWQMNDVWPGISWSGIDYYGRWKAMQYQVKKAYEPLLISAYFHENRIEIWANNDLHQKQEVPLHWQLQRMDGSTILEGNKILQIDPFSNAICEVVDWDKEVQGESKAACVLVLEYTHVGQKHERIYPLVKPKELQLENPKIGIKMEACPQGYQLEIQSDTYVYGMFLELPITGHWEDNYFQMQAGKTYTILFKTQERIPNIEMQLKLHFLGK